MKIHNTKEMENVKLKAIIYAPSASGKTTLAKTCRGRTLVISAESGLLSLKGADVDYIDISQDDKGEKIELATDRLKRLHAIFSDLRTGVIKGHANVFLDSLTEISSLVVAHLKLKYPDRKDSMPMWGENRDIMTKLVKDFRDLPTHNVFVTCLSDVDKDDVGKRFITFNITGKLAGELPGFFDEVFYLAPAEGHTRNMLYTKGDNPICKDRSNMLAAIEPPDLGAIQDKIFAKEVKENKK